MINRVGPDIGGKVLVGVTDTGVEDGHEDVAGGGLEVPTKWSIDFGQAPKRAIEVFGVIGNGGSGVAEIIRLGEVHQAAGLVGGDEAGNGLAGRDGQNLEAGFGGEIREDGDAVLLVEKGKGERKDVGLGLDEDAVEAVGGARQRWLNCGKTEGKENGEIREGRNRKGREKAQEAQKDAPD